MDKRFFLALVLTALVVIVTPMIFRPVPAVRDTLRTDSSGVTPPVPETTTAQPPVAAAPAAVVGDQVPARGDSAPPAPAVLAETTTVSTPLATYALSNLGAAVVSAELERYASLRPSTGERNVSLLREGDRLFRLRLLTARDTLAIDTIPFVVTEARSPEGSSMLRFDGRSGELSIELVYTFEPNSYVVHVAGSIQGFTPPALLLIDLPAGLRSEEADTLADQRMLAYVYKPLVRDASSITFDDLEPGERQVVPGALSWVAAKTKYFLVGVLAPDEGQAFGEFVAIGGPRTTRVATEARGTIVRPLSDGSFAFEVYAGPQEWRRLRALGRDFENVNPYGWSFLQGIIQPFATIVMRILLWMRDTLQINYGWILVIFGVGVRLLLWPLNQRAMRSSLRMQQIQPELMEIQKRYAGSQPEKYREEVMKVYKAHGMSPLSPLLGCVPMLIPMPIFIALFFVFQNTIEFRGVEFLWLPDISLKDPLYVLPLLMGASMFLLSWIGMRSAPPNPQTKLLTYVMPVMFTAFLINFAAGLNLYYFIQNLAALPQQWLIARERSRAAPARAVKPA